MKLLGDGDRMSGSRVTPVKGKRVILLLRCWVSSGGVVVVWDHWSEPALAPKNINIFVGNPEG